MSYEHFVILSLDEPYADSAEEIEYLKRCKNRYIKVLEITEKLQNADWIIQVMNCYQLGEIYYDRCVTAHSVDCDAPSEIMNCLAELGVNLEGYGEIVREPHSLEDIEVEEDFELISDEAAASLIGCKIVKVTKADERVVFSLNDGRKLIYDDCKGCSNLFFVIDED